MVIFRAREGISVASGRSRCRACKQPIGARDLVPLLSYALLRGRCRACKTPITWQYPAVELATGVLFLLAFLSAPNVLVFRLWVFVSVLIVIFVYDLRYLLIPDRFTVPAMMVAFLANAWLGLVPVWSMMAGALALSAFFWIQFLVSKGTWVGGGDVRMGALMGLMLGFEYGLVALFVAYVLGALVGAGLLLSGTATRRTLVPFGTFLSVGTLVALLVGPRILGWYLGFL